MGKAIRWNKETLTKFRAALAEADAAKLDMFKFEGTMFPVRYARYISAYLGSRLQG